MNKISILCVGLVSVFATLFLTVNTAQAVCKENVCASLVNAGGNGQQASATVTNSSGISKQVAFYTDKVFVRPYQEGWLSTQELFAYKIITLAAGETRTVSIDTPNCMAQFDVHVGYPAQTEQTILLGLFTNNTNLCIHEKVTVSGRVTKCGAGVSGVAVETCNLGTVYTDANGNWSASADSGQGYCARISQSGAKGVNNTSCYANSASYEWQIAGQNKFTGCSSANNGSWDRNSDSNVDFVIDCPPACANECTVNNQRVCDGNSWKQCTMGSDGCYHWGSLTDCGLQACNNGSCNPTCQDECTFGQFQCSGSSVRICGKYNNSCTSWGNYQSCDSRCYRCGDSRCECGETQSSCPQDCGYNTPTVDLRSSGSASCNENATLSWTSTNATSCTASGSWSGSRSTSGTESVDSFTGTRSYTITCTGSGGSASDTVTLNGSDDPLEVNAGSDKDIDAGDSVRLDGSVDGDYDSLSWTCTGGSLSDYNVLRPTYRAPFNYNSNYDYDRDYTCTLTARNECGADSDSVRISVNRQTTDFNVSLIARPKSDCAPLENVDLIAALSNYGSGYDNDYTYYFDCENDGIWDKTVTTENTSYTAADLCDYRNIGSYTAKVKVESSGRTATDSEIVRAEACGQPQAGAVSITKTVSDLTRGTGYQGSVTANPSDTVAYRVVVAGVSGTAGDVRVTDIVPAGIANIGNLLIDGMPIVGANLANGIDLGSLSQGQTKTITYTGTVAGENYFNYGQTTLNNVATVYAGNDSANSSAAVYVYRRAVAGATTISTGFDGMQMFGTGLALAGILLTTLWLFAKPGRRDARAILRDRVAAIRKGSR